MKVRLSPAEASTRAKFNIILATCCYLVTYMVCSHLLAGIPAGPAQDAVALIPVLSVFWVLWSIALYISRADELQRRVHLEALAISAGVTAALAITYSLLEESAGFPRIPIKLVFLALGLLWSGSGIVLWRRYR